MKKKIILFCLVICICNSKAFSQNSFYDSIANKAIPFTFGNFNKSISITANFPEKDFYLFGEWHGTNANLLLAFDMIT
jgi:hypothetical protein